MTKIGYFLVCEEHDPRALVEYARKAEEVGFDFALISDHFHPWIDRQGQSPFVWAVIGGIAGATTRLELGTAVTCPTMRIHPAIIAQAAATAATMMPGRFSLGVGTGEKLNEHILGQRWPSGRTRLAMLEEAVEVIQLLWQGGMRSFHGRYFTVENARLYTLPDEPPRLLLGAGGPRAAALAARIGDGLVTNGVSPDVVAAFNAAGGAARPRYGMVGVCWAESESVARQIAFDRWPTAALTGGIHTELPLPRHFEQVVSIVTEDDVASCIVCGPDPDRHLEAIHQARAAGYDRVCIAQVGPDQEGFFHFYEREVLPQLH